MAEGRLLQAVSPVALRFATSPKIRSIQSQDIVPRTLREWVAGESYAAIRRTPVEVDARIGGNRIKPTVEHAVALCEGGFGYDVAMIVASLADLAEELDETLHAGVALLQGQIKAGLTDQASLVFHEAGFADQHVAAFLGGQWPLIADRNEVHTVCRQEAEIRAALSDIPSHFRAVAAKLGGWAP